MKKLLVLVAVLAVAVSAQAANFELRFSDATPGVSGDGMSADLAPSDTAELELWITGDYANGLYTWLVGLSTTPADQAVFSFEQVVPGPAWYNTDLPQPAPGAALNGWALTNAVYYPYIAAGSDPILAATLILHGVADSGTVSIGLTDNQGTANITDPNFGRYTPLDLSSTVTVNAVPEPASLALIALGGLALIRRR